MEENSTFYRRGTNLSKSELGNWSDLQECLRQERAEIAKRMLVSKDK